MAIAQNSEFIGNVLKAMANVQDKVIGFKHDDANPHFKNRFTSLNSINNALRPVLRQEGLLMLQYSAFNEQGVQCLVCHIHHEESEEWIAGWFELIVTKKDPQQMGSSLSYMRRYSILTMFNLLTADDDAEFAAGRGRQAQDDDPDASDGKTYEKKPKSKKLQGGVGGADYKKDATLPIGRDRAVTVAKLLNKEGIANASIPNLIESALHGETMKLESLNEIQAKELLTAARRMNEQLQDS